MKRQANWKSANIASDVGEIFTYKGPVQNTPRHDGIFSKEAIPYCPRNEEDTADNQHGNEGS
jgi:hypothetical protein